MNYEFDAFSEGVADGGLRNKNQIKLVIEYLSALLTDPLTKEVAVEALTSSSLANYFETVQAIDELISMGNIKLGEDNVLVLTRQGSESLDTLMNEIPASIRESAISAASIIQLRKKNEEATNTKIIKNGDSYDVVCKIMNKDVTLVELKLHADDYEQADKIKNTFIEKPEKLYEAVVSLLY